MGKNWPKFLESFPKSTEFRGFIFTLSSRESPKDLAQGFKDINSLSGSLQGPMNDMQNFRLMEAYYIAVCSLWLVVKKF